jgi:hypothetical protein
LSHIYDVRGNVLSAQNTTQPWLFKKDENQTSNERKNMVYSSNNFLIKTHFLDMKTNLLQLPALWQDFSIAAGIVGISALLGFYAHKFAEVMQASLFGDWGFL